MEKYTFIYVIYLKVAGHLVPHDASALVVEDPPEMHVLTPVGEQDGIVVGVEAPGHHGVRVRL